MVEKEREEKSRKIEAKRPKLLSLRTRKEKRERSNKKGEKREKQLIQLPGIQTHRDIPGPEQKLSVEIGLLNGVHVCNSDCPILPTA